MMKTTKKFLPLKEQSIRSSVHIQSRKLELISHPFLLDILTKYSLKNNP